MLSYFRSDVRTPEEKGNVNGKGWLSMAGYYTGVSQYGADMGDLWVKSILQSPQIQERIVEFIKDVKRKEILPDPSLFDKWIEKFEKGEKNTETLFMDMMTDIPGPSKKLIKNMLIIATLPDTVQDKRALYWYLFDNGVDILDYENLFLIFEKKEKKNDPGANTENNLNNINALLLKRVETYGNGVQKNILDQTKALAPAAISEILKSKEVGDGAGLMARNFLQSTDLSKGVETFLGNTEIRVATKGLVKDVVRETIEENVPTLIQNYLPEIVHASVRETGPYVISGIMLLAGVYVGVHKATRQHVV